MLSGILFYTNKVQQMHMRKLKVPNWNPIKHYGVKRQIVFKYRI